MNVYVHIALSNQFIPYNIYKPQIKNFKQINITQYLLKQICFHYILLCVPFASKYAEKKSIPIAF